MNYDSNIFNFLTTIEKLDGFPTLNFISVEDSIERRTKLLQSIRNNFNSIKVSQNIFSRYKQIDFENEIQMGNWIPMPPSKMFENHLGMLGATSSHLKTIKNWYLNTNEDYTIICEDDICLNTIQYWNFTWKQFLNILPKDWGCIQLQITRINMAPMLNNCSKICYPKTKIKTREICNWGCCAYLISRSRAKKLIDTYYPNDKIIYEYRGSDLSERLDYGPDNPWAFYPSIENIIYSNFEDDNVYSFPLFVEDINQKSTLKENNSEHHLHSYLTVLSWWRGVGKYLSVVDLI